VFTGDTPTPGYPAEGEVGRNFAIGSGIPASAVLYESTSRTTWQNLTNARELLAPVGIQTVLLVSDPLHMRRAMAMADSIGLRAAPAPTSSSRFQSLVSRGEFLWRETCWTLNTSRSAIPRRCCDGHIAPATRLNALRGG
jgi:uncharacterized SAM-binding protein YcdF (DUF218 family)